MVVACLWPVPAATAAPVASTPSSQPALAGPLSPTNNNDYYNIPINPGDSRKRQVLLYEQLV